MNWVALDWIKMDCKINNAPHPFISYLPAHDAEQGHCKASSYPPPPPLLRKHQPGQESDGPTGSWCFNEAVQPRDTRYQTKHVLKNCPYLTLSTIVATGH